MEKKALASIYDRSLETQLTLGIASLQVAWHIMCAVIISAVDHC